VNNIVGHFAPYLADDATVLKDGDLVKVDLGCQIDGYAAQAAHTFVVGDAKVDGPKANAVLAAYNAAEAALRLLVAGNKNSKVTQTIKSITKDFGCNAVQGVLSHSQEQNKIDGEKVIINREEAEHKVAEIEFAVNEVYCVDVVVSSGDGKPFETDLKTTIYKRVTDAQYALKLKQSREVFTDIKANHPYFPFNIKVLDQKIASYGIKEVKDHGLIVPLPVLREKDGIFVAQFKFTVLLMPNGTVRLSSYPAIDTSKFVTDKKISDASVVELLSKPFADPVKKNKKAEKKAEAK
jgi:curved DNA binding protein